MMKNKKFKNQKNDPMYFGDFIDELNRQPQSPYLIYKTLSNVPGKPSAELPYCGFSFSSDLKNLILDNTKIDEFFPNDSEANIIYYGCTRLINSGFLEIVPEICLN